MIDEARFWEKVDRRDPESCWPWTGGRAGCGAGIVYISHPEKSSTLAHRVAWRLAGRDIEPRVRLRQECGELLCVNPAHMKLLTPETRFWEAVDVGTEDEDGCWEWTKGTRAGGYGRFKRHGVEMPAHRAAWEFQNGPLDRHLFALHRCDNPPCCRPSHIFPGTAADNVADMIAKGRRRFSNVKLSADDVAEIRGLQGREVGRSVALRFGVCTATVHHVWSGRTWRGVAA